MSETILRDEETQQQSDTAEQVSPEWSTPEFAEQSACAEIGAYVFAV